MLMLKWFELMTFMEWQTESEIRCLTAVKGAMEKCFSRMRKDASDVTVFYRANTGSLDLSYDRKGERICLPVRCLSNGYKNTLYMVADIAYRMAVLNPQLRDRVLVETPGIVLIDNIDLRLHPGEQKRILRDLTEIFPKVQFIVSTCSPCVISSVLRDHLLVLNEDGTWFIPDFETYGSDANSVLTGIMGES